MNTDIPMTRHKIQTNPSETSAFNCDLLTQEAPRFVAAMQEFVQRSLPLLPPDIPLASLQRVLDVGCGRHLWGRDLFRTMLEQAGLELVADVRIEGIDSCPQSVQTARQSLRTTREQVSVSLGDLFHLPATSSGSYQLVQMRFLSLSIPPSAWPVALAHLARLCTPGGTVIWLEPSLPLAGEGTPGWKQFLSWIQRAISVHGGTLMQASTMDWLFQQAGPWTRLRRSIIEVPLFPATATQGNLPAEHRQTLKTWLQEVRPWLMSSGISASDVEHGLQVVLEELNQRRIQSVWPWTIIAGTRPERRPAHG